jgi:hypothetical protein
MKRCSFPVVERRPDALAVELFPEVYQTRDRLVILRFVFGRPMPASACEIARDAP